MFKQPKKYRLRILFFSSILGLLLLAFALVWVLRYSRVQTWLVQKSESLIESLIDAEVSIESISLALPVHAKLDGIRLCTTDGELIGDIQQFELDLLSFSLWDYLLNNKTVHDISISSVHIDGVTFPVYRGTDGVLNLLAWIGSSNKEKKPTQRLLRLSIEDLKLSNSRFSYVDSLLLPPDSIRGKKFTPTEMYLTGIDLKSSFTLGPGRRFRGDITQLSVRDSLSGLMVKNLALEVEADTMHVRDERGWREVVPFVAFHDLTLREGLTVLNIDARFPRTELMDILRGDLINRYVEARWTDSRIHSSSIQKFLSKALPFEGLIQFHGTTVGTLNDLYSADMALSLGPKTSLSTKFRITDLLNYQKTLLDIQVNDGQVNLYEIRKFLLDPGIPTELDSVTLSPFQGRFAGHYEDFQIQVNTKSEAGTLVTNLHLQIPPKVREFTYEGIIQTEGFNPNEFGFRQVLDSRFLNVSARVKGQGLNIKTLSTDMTLKMWDSDLWGRRVDSLSASLTVLKKRVTGRANGLDKGARADLALDVDFGPSPATYSIRGGVSQFNLQRYGIWDESLIVNTRVAADFLGDSLEQVAGKFALGEFSLVSEDKTVFNMYRAELGVQRNSDGEKIFELTSPLADVNLKGNFTLKKIGQLGAKLAKESKLYFSNEDSVINEYYTSKAIDSIDTKGNLRIRSKPQINDLLAFFKIPVSTADQTTVNLSFTFGMWETMNIEATSDWVKYDQLIFEDIYSTGEVFKSASDNKLGLLTNVSANRLNLGDERYLERLSWEIDGIDDHFNGIIRIRQDKERNTLQLLSSTDFKPDGSIYSELNAEKSLLVVNGDSLVLMPGNAVVFKNGVVDIQNILLQSDATYFRLDGLVSKNPENVLTLSVGQFPLSLLADFVEFTYLPQGMFNLEVRMQQLLTDPCLSISSRIDDFSLDDFAYGNIFTEGHWQSTSKHLQLDASLIDKRDTTLVLSGYYNLGDTTAPLHFNLATNQSFPMGYAYPFVKTQLYELKGKVDLDQFTITGSPSKPIVLGTGHFIEAGFGVDYFKTSYTFDGSITFDNDRIRFPRLRLYDQNRNYAQLYGFIYHEGLSDFRFDLQVEEANNFLLMNTQKGDNDLFYGRMVLKNGLGSVTGNLQKLNLDMFATTGKGSFLRIPLEDDASEGRPDFIHFSGEERSETSYTTGLQDFEINLNVAMTPDLEVDLIFDERVGDIIRGKGVGNLNMYINEAGEFTMYGEFEITEGNYLFTAQNILNKKFLVKPGGTIVWSGDPYDAQVNLEAYYSLSADISQLLQEDQTIRTPVNVNMAMNGSLLAPAIDVSIELPSLSESDASQIASYLKSIQYDEQELNKQVFSLMVFNRFAPVGGFLGTNAASTGVTTSISELISNQLNYWLGKAIGENINFGVGTNNFQDVNLLVSASLFNDRVVIERDGTLIDDNANLTIGNVSVQIKLLPPTGQAKVQGTRPSELVLEVFTRESLDARLNNNTNQTGLGIFYKKDFDRIGELFQKKRKK
ncbi:MAG: translocation/assembly module TamB [Bacteroidia bacterium]|nr:translocation/assembly module TamB [Bacteroidia bacterium]